MKLYYFEHYGRGESIRMLANHAKIPNFEDIRIKRDTWDEHHKHTGKYEFAQVPLLEITDESGQVHQYTQSLAILRYLGLRYGYYPASDPELAWLVDSTMDATKDIVDRLVKVQQAKEQEVKEKLMEEIIGGPFPIFLNAISNRLEK